MASLLPFPIGGKNLPRFKKTGHSGLSDKFSLLISMCKGNTLSTIFEKDNLTHEVSIGIYLATLLNSLISSND